jgi:hypothetical protein
MLIEVLRQISRRTESQPNEFAIIEPIPSIYVDSGITTPRVWHTASIAARSKADQLEALARAVDVSRTTELAYVVAEGLGLLDVEFEELDERSDPRPGPEEWPSRDVVVTGAFADGPEARILVTNEVGWLYPDDGRIWKHLAASVEESRTGMIIARKAHLAVFPVMKRLGGFANELHHLYCADNRIAATHSKALAGWPLVRETKGARTHAALGKIKDLVANNVREQPARGALIRSAIDLGLGDEGSPDRLLEWVRTNKIRMHGRWVHQVRRWQHWKAHNQEARRFDS